MQKTGGVLACPNNLFKQLQDQATREKDCRSSSWSHLGLAKVTKQPQLHGRARPQHNRVTKVGEGEWKAAEHGNRFAMPQHGRPGLPGDEHCKHGSELHNYEKARRPVSPGDEHGEHGSGPHIYEETHETVGPEAGGHIEEEQVRTLSMKEQARAAAATWSNPAWGAKGKRQGRGGTDRTGLVEAQPWGKKLGETMAHPSAVEQDGNPRRTRPRGRRGRGVDPAEYHFITMNTSGKQQLLENMDRLDTRNTRTCVILNQEHRQWQSEIGPLQYMAGASGWKVGAAPAAVGPKGGASAGVAVIARKCVGFDKVLDGWSGGKGEAEGRVAAAWVQAVTKAGLLVISIYL